MQEKEGLKMKTLFIFCFFMFASVLHAENVIWSGTVNSDGIPSELVKLELDKRYQIRVSGFVNLGKWIQNREKLANDACYEYNSEGNLEKLESLRNSLDISVCDGSYHPQHIYQSLPFVTKHNRIHFWVHDFDYDDNHGAFKVEVLQIPDEKSLIAK